MPYLLKMNLQVTLVAFALCSTLFCSIKGAPAGGSEAGEGSQSNRKEKGFCRYSRQEDEFLLEEAQSQTKTSDKISWKRIAEKHEERVKNKVEGFENKRTPNNLKQHYRIMTLKTNNNSDGTPRKFFHKNTSKYTEQEEDFINEELLDDSFQSCSLYGDQIWIEILERHNLKRKQNCKGFWTERSFGGLRHHFLRNMRPGKRISKEVKARFPNYFKGQEGTSAENYDEENHPGHNTDQGDDGISVDDE